MYKFEDLISNYNDKKVIFVDKNDPCFDNFINLLMENNCLWHSGNRPDERVYDKTYYVINEHNRIGYSREIELTDYDSIIYMNEIEYEKQKDIDIDVEVFL